MRFSCFDGAFTFYGDWDYESYEAEIKAKMEKEDLVSDVWDILKVLEKSNPTILMKLFILNSTQTLRMIPSAFGDMKVRRNTDNIYIIHSNGHSPRLIIN